MPIAATVINADAVQRVVAAKAPFHQRRIVQRLLLARVKALHRRVMASHPAAGASSGGSSSGRGPPGALFAPCGCVFGAFLFWKNRSKKRMAGPPCCQARGRGKTHRTRPVCVIIPYMLHLGSSRRTQKVRRL